ncbi:MAG: alkaline phosphatase D family protein [Ideonella sp.]|nr:alkaline phosphatase D family protein [Ideonella sp.]MCC7458401.1 alkaline phosphatase D family protein [Nitrospira sp.]
MADRSAPPDAARRHESPHPIPRDRDARTPLSRRGWLAWAGGAVTAPIFVRHARAADVPRFALGVASGQPGAHGIVLWTRLTGPELPPRVEVRWQLARDEAFTDIAATGHENAIADEAHSVHAEPGGLEPARGYWYRFEALGQRSAVGRTRTAPAPDAPAATLSFALASCQRFDHGHYAAWRHVAGQAFDFVLFVGDYIYERASPPGALRAHEGGRLRTLEQYRARYAQYKGDPALQAAHAALPWLMVWDDHEVENDYAGLQGQHLQSDFADQRAAAYRAYWEHMPFPKSARPAGPDMRIVGRCDWGTLARIHLLDDRQYRDPQVCPRPDRGGGSNTVRLRDCPQLLDAQRTLLGAEQERWLAQGWDPQRRWNLLAQQTLMARLSWSDPATGGTYWTDGWDGYAPARNRLLGTVAERKVPGVVVLGGDVHAHYVADLKADFDAARAPVIATELCGTSIASHGIAQERITAALHYNPHVHYGRSDQRGYVACRLDGRTLQASLMAVDRPDDPDSAVRVAARFAVDARQPGAQTA